MPKAKIIVSDVLEGLKGLPSESVQCVITSPPYWGLRDYGTEGQIGLEDTPEEYVERMVGVFREVRRVLRADGVLFLNIGDSYATGAGKVGKCPGGGKQGENWKGATTSPNRMPLDGLKPKDLVGVPWRLALALQADGWWLRSDIIWAKPNPMPESITDRPTKSHEYIFLMAKSQRYFWDYKAAQTDAKTTWRATDMMDDPESGSKDAAAVAQGLRTRGGMTKHSPEERKTANMRTVWNVSVTSLKDAHFATFPPALVEPMVKVGTSDKGACPECGNPWERVVEVTRGGPSTRKGREEAGATLRPVQRGGFETTGAAPGDTRGMPSVSVETVGFHPDCECHGSFVNENHDWEPDIEWMEDGPPITPCTVLDPFSGAGTTGLVALRFGRDYIGIELNPKYAAMSRKRIRADAPLFNEVR
jgi:DNA modification methylase